jgi:hypothetical protein
MTKKCIYGGKSQTCQKSKEGFGSCDGRNISVYACALGYVRI